MREADAGIAETGRDAGPLGILAGAGAFPIEIAGAVLGRGRTVHIVALDGFAEPETTAFPHEKVGLGQVARILRSFRRAGCREIVIAGGLRRPDLTRLKPDWGLVRYLPTILSLTRGGDDSVLRRVVRFFEQQGFAVRGATDVAPELLAPAGPLGALTPNSAELAAIKRAARAIRVLGAFDIGQAAVATSERVIAIESVRGTDALLASLAGSLSGIAKGGVLVKLAKPGQEMRVDLPAIGPRTVDGATAAGLSGVAIGAGEAIVLDRSKLSAQSDAAGLFVYGLPKAAGAEDLAAPAPLDPHAMRPLAVLARRAPTPSERSDVYIGRQLIHVLARESLGRAAVISGHHVLAIATELDIPAMLANIGRDSQWGRRVFKPRIGTLVIDLGPGDGETAALSESLLSLEVFAAVKDARLAGVAVLGGRIPEQRRADVIGWANDARLFLLAEEATHD